MIVERYWVFENPISVIVRENFLWVGIGLCMAMLFSSFARNGLTPRGSSPKR